MAKYIRPVTPTEDSSPAADLCGELSPNERATYVDVAPNADEPANECFHVVGRHVERFGGACLVGWAIWELPKVFVEAEFHAVWRSPSGELLDVTPKSTPSARILFLPDQTRTYEGFPRNNVRRAISASPAVRDFLAAHDARYELMNRGGRAREHGEIHLHGSEAVEFQQLEAAIAELGYLTFDLHPEVGPYLPCLCGSGRKAKWCHGAAYEEAR